MANVSTSHCQSSSKDSVTFLTHFPHPITAILMDIFLSSCDKGKPNPEKYHEVLGINQNGIYVIGSMNHILFDYVLNDDNLEVINDGI